MNRYHIDSNGRTVDQYGRVFEYEPPKENQRRKISIWKKPRTTFVKLKSNK